MADGVADDTICGVCDTCLLRPFSRTGTLPTNDVSTTVNHDAADAGDVWSLLRIVIQEE